VAHLESNRLFLVHTESGAEYTGRISTTGESNDPPIRIEVAEAPSKEVEVPQRKIIKLRQTGEGFWHQFDGAVNTGSLCSKGDESVQYNVSSQVAYTRERWSSEVNYNSSFASNSGSSLSTRNETDLDTLRLLRVFKFKKTNVDVSSSRLPAISEAGRVHFNTNAVYYIKLINDLSWNFSFYGSWDTRPPPTLPKSDYAPTQALAGPSAIDKGRLISAAVARSAGLLILLGHF
jgi:hypothetical protein